MNKFDERNENIKDQNWFIRTTFKIGVLSAATFGIYKMRGPAKSLADKYLNQYKDKIIERESWKKLDSKTRMLGSTASINQPNFGLDLDDQEFDRMFQKKDDFVFTLETDPLKVLDLETQENSLIKTIELDIGNDAVIDKHDVLFKLRKDALYERINTSSLLRMEDRAALESINNIKDSDKLEALHNFYMSNDLNYYRKYKQKLTAVTHDYRTSMNKMYVKFGHNPKITSDIAKDFIYGTAKFDASPETAVKLRYQAKELKKDMYQPINVFELLKQKKPITSGSFVKKDLTDQFEKDIASFDYSNLLKDLGEKIEELQDKELRPKSYVKNVSYTIARENSFGSEERWFLNIALQHETRGTAEIRVPVSQHGLIPGSKMSVTEQLDGFYLKPEKHFVPNLLHTNLSTDYQNKTQMILKKVFNILDGSQMERDFADNPQSFARSVQNIITNLLDDPIAGRSGRDFIKMNRLVFPNPSPKISKYYRERLGDIVATGRSMKSFSQNLKNKSNMMIIDLDFETISRDTPGLNWMAKDDFTEITEVGFVVQDYENGKLIKTDMDKIHSNHAVHAIDGWREKKNAINWIRSQTHNSEKMTDVELIDSWKSQVNNDAEWSRLRHGKTFHSNHDIAQHAANKLLISIKKAVSERKKVFINTKNSRFDLEFLKAYAGHEWSYLKKYVQFIDSQSIAHLYNIKGQQGSMSLSNIMIRMMKGYGATRDDILPVAKGSLTHAIRWLKSKDRKLCSIDDAIIDEMEKSKVLGLAHSSTVDALASNFILFKSHEDLFGHPEIYKEFSEIEKFLARCKNSSSLSESMEEAKLREVYSTVNGMTISSHMLAQGQAAKRMMSRISNHHISSYTDSPLSKQWDQFHAGVRVSPSDRFLKEMNNSKDKQLYNKYFKSVFLSRGEIGMYKGISADAMTNNFQHHVILDTIHVFNPYMGEGGYNAVSTEAFKNYKIHFTERVDLSQVQSGGEDPILNKRLIDMQNKIYKEARALANGDHGKINKHHLEMAARKVVETMDSLGETIINPVDRSNTLSHGDANIKTSKKEFGGKILNVVTNLEAGKISMHADIEYLANGESFEDMPFRLRNESTKSMGVVDNYNSLLIANGANHLSDAGFLTKGYVHAQKSMLTFKIMSNLFDTYNDPNASEVEKRYAEKTLQRLAKDVKGQPFDINNRQIVHDPDANPEFSNILDPMEIEQSKKYYGNVDMSFSKLDQYMVDARIVWTEEKFNQWLGLWGGEKNLRKFINQSISSHTHYIEKQLKSTGKTLGHLEQSAIQDYSTYLNEWFLPSMEKVKSGKAAMYWEPFKKYKDGSTMTFGYRGPSRYSLYGIASGNKPVAKEIKMRSSILHFITQPFSHVTPSTVKSIKASKRAYGGNKFSSAYATLRRYKDTICSNAMAKGHDLNLDDINRLLDNKGDIDVKKLARWSFSDEEKSKIISNVIDDLQEATKDGSKLQGAIETILNEMQQDKFEKAFEKGSNLITTVAAEKNWENLAKEKGGVFTYSKRPELGGGFTFHINELLDRTPGFTDDEVTKAKNLSLDFFEHIYKNSPDGFVKDFDREKGQVTLKYLAIHADTSKANVMNYINKSAQEKGYGYLSTPAKYQRHLFNAMKEYELEVKKLSSGSNQIKVQEEFLKKQYLLYTLKGFLMDSSSIYARSAQEYVPVGLQSHIIGTSAVIEKAREIMYQGGIEKAYGVKGSSKHDQLIKRLAEESDFTDVIVSEDVFKKMQYPDGTNIYEKLKKTKTKEEVKRVMSGLESHFMYSNSNPNIQAASDAIQSHRLTIVPKDVRKYLAVSNSLIHANSMQVKLAGRDNDGDRMGFVVHAYETADDLVNLQKEHSEYKRKVLESYIGRPRTAEEVKAGDASKIITFGEYGIKGWVRDFSNGNVNYTYYDDAGREVHTSVPINSSKAEELLGDPFFSNYAKNAYTLEMNTPARATTQEAYKQLDRVCATVVSKNNIGLATNIAYKMTRHLMQVGLTGKNPDAAKLLYGNLSTGDAGIAQLFISLAKHETDIKGLEQVSKVYANPLTRDAETHNGAKQFFERLMPKGMEGRGEEIYRIFTDSMKAYNEYTPRDSISSEIIKSIDDIDGLKDGTNIMNAIMSTAHVDFLNDYGDQIREQYRSPTQEMFDVLGKKFKFDPSKINFKKGGKIGAVGAAVYLASNFFRPHQLSNSLNPFDAFTDLGSDIDSSQNRKLFTDLELERSIPLDMVNASFSKKAYIKLNKRNNNQDKSMIINDMLKQGYSSTNPLLHEWRTSPSYDYADYTTNVGSFGTTSLDRKSRY
jgi:hypothetical protein